MQDYSGLCLFYRSYGLDHPRRLPHNYAPRRHVSTHHRARRNRTALADAHARQDHHIAAHPDIVANDHRPRILHVVAPALHARLVRGGVDGHVGAEHDAVPDGDEPAVEDGQVEVGVEPRADLDVAAVVDVEGRLDEGLVVGHVAEQVLEPGQAELLQRVERCARLYLLGRGEVGVVPVAPGAGFEARVGQFGDHGVVSVSFRVSLCWLASKTDGELQHAGDHALVLLAPGRAVQGACERELLFVFVLGCAGHDASYVDVDVVDVDVDVDVVDVDVDVDVVDVVRSRLHRLPLVRYRARPSHDHSTTAIKLDRK
jgi:hypothetical protein